MIGEVFGQWKAEYAGYVTGKTIVSVVTPHIRVAPLKQSLAEPKQRWVSLTYVRGGTRLLSIARLFVLLHSPRHGSRKATFARLSARRWRPAPRR
jgi:hypothetical protein